MYNVEQIEIRYEESDTVFVKGSLIRIWNLFSRAVTSRSPGAMATLNS